MARLALLLHGRDADVPLYEQALGGAARNIHWGSGAPAYSEVAGLARDYPTLRAFLEAEVPEWSPGTQLVLVAFSSGGWAARHWMRHQADRELVSALLLLDCLYGEPGGGPCPARVVEGPIQYGLLAAAQPRQRTLVATSSSYTQPCVARLKRALPKSPAIHIFAPAGTHREHMTAAGPESVREWVAPKLGWPLGPLALPLAGGAALGIGLGWAARYLRSG